MVQVHPVGESDSLMEEIGSAATSAAAASPRLLIKFLFQPGRSLASNTPESCILAPGRVSAGFDASAAYAHVWKLLDRQH